MEWPKWWSMEFMLLKGDQFVSNETLKFNVIEKQKIVQWGDKRVSSIEFLISLNSFIYNISSSTPVHSF